MARNSPLSGSGESAQDEDSVAVFARCDVLFRDEVHAVVEGGDEAQVGGAIVMGQIVVAHLPLDEDDGFPARGLEGVVDAFDGFFDLDAQIGVLLNFGAAGGGNLNKDELFYVPGMLLEQVFDGEEPLDNALGVIHAVYAEKELLAFDSQLAMERT